MDKIDWEYEAPKFIDFEANEHLLDNTDKYFDRAHESNCFPEDFILSTAEDSCSKSAATSLVDDKAMLSPSKEILAASTPSRILRSSNKQVENSAIVKDTELSQPSTTLSVDAHFTAISSQNSLCSTPHRDRCEGNPLRVLRSNMKKTQSSTPAPANTVVLNSVVDPTNEQKENKPSHQNVMTPNRLNTRPRNTKKVVTGSNSLHSYSTKNKLRKNISKTITTEATAGPPKKKAKKENMTVKYSAGVCIPHSHKHHKRNFTSEELELKKIEELRSTAKLFREKSKEQLKKLEQSTPKLAAKPHVTKTQEFHFETDVRVAKSHSMTTRFDASQDTSHFETGLRKYAQSPLKKPKNTVVQPFNLSKGKRKLMEEQVSVPAFVPMAKAILDFQSRTPQRYRFAKNSIAKNSSKPLRATVPHTPNITKSKSRPITILSSKEKEELEIKEMKKQQFKAKPVCSAILEGPKQIKKVEKKPCTVPVEFHLSSNSHTTTHNEPEQEHTKEFKAQPIPESVFHKPLLKKKQCLEVTVPQSPAFALKNRVRVLTNKEIGDVQTPAFYHPPPKNTHVFKPKLNSIKTEVEPFSFDAKDKERRAKKEEKIKEIVKSEKSSCTFKAHPMPIALSPSESLPTKQTKEPTKPEPFHLDCHERVALRVHEWEKQVVKDVQDMREKANFKANQDYEKIIKCKPWEPKIDHKSTTDPLKVVLRSEVRAKEREEFNKRMQTEHEEKELRLKEQQMREEELSKKKIEELRKKLVHKAQDVRKFKGVNVAKSSKPLTLPESPKFSTRFNK